MDEHKLALAIKGIVGTRTYLPISLQESLFVIERKGYIHIFHGIHSTYGSTDESSVAKKLIEKVNQNGLTYHPELLELINGF